MFAWGKKNATYLGLLLAVVVFCALLFSASTAHALNCLDGYVQIGGRCVPEDQAAAAASKSPQVGGGGADTIGFWDIITAPAVLFAWILYLILEALGVLLAICASFLNLVVSISILGMHQFLNPESGLGSSVNLAWQLIRDIINIVFVFLLLFVGINMILGSMSESKFTTKLIPKILLAALLINFSMFFTKAIIDVSNIVTVEFYNAATRFDQKTKIPGTEDMEAQGLAGAMMANLHLTDFYRGNLTREPGKESVDANRHILVSMIMAIIAVIIAMFIFLAVAFMLLGRFVIFIILIITSPLMFMGQLLPQLKSQVDKWWQALWGQALFAPVFFAMLLVALTVVNGKKFWSYGGFAGSPGAGTGFEEFVGGGVGTIVKFFIVIFFLITALVLAKKVSGEAGKGIADAGSKWAGSLAFGAGLGGTAMLARNTLGRGGQMLTNSGTVGSLIESKKAFGAVSLLGKGLSNAGNWAQRSTFDTRATGVGGIAKSAGISLGDVTRKGGLVGGQERRAKEREERWSRYARNTTIAAQETRVRELTNQQNQGPLDEKTQQELHEAQDTLAELKGGTWVSQARKDLAESSVKLTDAQKKEADETDKVIKVKRALVKKLEEDLAKNPASENTKAQLAAANASLAATTTTLSEDARKWLSAKDRVASSVKQAKSQVRSSEVSRAERLAGSYAPSNRMMSDAVRKGKEKPEETITKELKKLLAESQQQQKPPEPAAAPTPQPGPNNPANGGGPGGQGTP